MTIALICRLLPVRYYIHKEGQFLNLNGKVPLRHSIGTVQHVQVSTWDMHLLNDPNVNNNCQDDMFVDDTFDNCLYNALEYHMVHSTKTGCTVPWTRNNSRICSDPEDVVKAFDISWRRGTNQVCQHLCISLTTKLYLFDTITLCLFAF